MFRYGMEFFSERTKDKYLPLSPGGTAIQITVK